MAELILHLPGLESAGASALPEPLTGALGKARHLNRFTTDPLEALLGRGAVPEPAVLSALGRDVDPGARYWLRFDVLRMMPDLTAVWIDRPLPVDFDAPAYAELKRELSELFDAEGLEGRYRFAGRFGLIELDAPPACAFSGLDVAQGGRLDEFLPAGDEAPRWRRLITASQMVFHAHRALDRADQIGAGLWFWGGGVLESRASHPGALRVADVFDSETARGLAAWLGAPLETDDDPFPGSAEGCIVAGLPLDHPDPGRGLRVLVSDWLEPALEALGRGRLAHLTIAGSNGAWRLGRWHRMAFWRRRIRGLPAPEAP